MNRPKESGEAFSLVAAAFTPMREDRSVDLAGIAPQVDHLLAQGVGSVFVCGSTGEGPLLSTTERRAVAEEWVRAADGRLPVIVHVGDAALVHAVELAAHAQEIGAAAVSAVAPYYFRPSDQASLVECCAQIAEGAPELPFFYYHAPAITGVALSMSPFLVAATKAIPTFAGIKFTNEDLRDFAGCLDTAAPHQRIYFGRDEILLSALALGATGAIGTTYNFLGGLFTEMVQASSAGDVARARSLQGAARQVIDVGLAHGGFRAFKAMMRLAGMPCGPSRTPLASVTEAESEQIAAELDAAGVLGHVTGGRSPRR